MLELNDYKANNPVALIIVHGVGEHAGRYDTFASALCEAGVDVVCYNQFGHGGRLPQGHIERWEDYRTELESVVGKVSEDYEQVGVLGHSMGSLVVMDWLQNTQRDVAFAILSGALIQVEAPRWKILLAQLSSGLMPTLRIPLGLDVSGISSLSDEVQRYQMDPLVFSKVSAKWGMEVLNRIQSVRQNIERLGGQPILIGHGVDDPINHVSGSRWLASQLNKISLKEYLGARHELHHDWCAEQWLEDIVKFIKARTGS